jgi:hypothetical protein
MTPILIFFFGVKPYWPSAPTCCLPPSPNGRHRQAGALPHIDWRVVLNLSAGSIPAALITLYMLHTVGAGRPAKVQSLMTTALGVALLLTAAATLYKVLRGKVTAHQRCQGPGSRPPRPRHWSLPLLFGAVIGTLVTLTSVGRRRHWRHRADDFVPLLPLPRIVAADIAYAVPLTLVAGLATPRWVRWTGPCWPSCWRARCPASGWART